MSNLKVCDRCKQELHQEAYKMGLGARKEPRFRWFQPTKSGATDMWELSQGKFDLCQDCTAEFMVFAQTPAKENL